MTTYRLTHDALRRGGRAVLRPAALDFPPGAIVGLVGANGAGKTTMMMALAGLLASADAEVACGDERVRAVGYVPQQPRLPGWLTVREVMELRELDPAAVDPGLGFAALLDRRADSLSGGEVQLVSAIAALVANTRVLLLDEPLASLDIPHRRALSRLIAGRAGPAGGLTLISSHVAAELFDLCDWFLVIRGGGYVFNGSRGELLGGDPQGGGTPDARALFEEIVVGLLTG